MRCRKTVLLVATCLVGLGAVVGHGNEPKKPGNRLGDPRANPTIKPGDWAQWGGTSYRNNVPQTAAKIAIEWEPGSFNRITGEWHADSAKNIKWVATLGTQTYGNPVVADGRIYVGTNNGSGYLKRYPAEVDLGCLLCFRESDGKFLWQHSSEKLPTGRVHDWPKQGICCAPLVEGTRLWVVTSRGEVRCLDTEGFYDGEDDGPVTGEIGRLFDWRKTPDDAAFADAVAALGKGKLTQPLADRFAKSGMPIKSSYVVAADGKNRWTVTAVVESAERVMSIEIKGPKLSAFKVITPDDKHEADTVWVLDMMKELGVSQHNMAACSITSFGDLIFVNTSNGVDESHKNIPAPKAPSFICVDKNTGKVYWTDSSPGLNILHGQWSSPTIGILGGVPQVLFAGGDGWLYSFAADKGANGKPTLLWKFDCNPKESKWELGGTGTRNNLIATPVIYDGLVYIAVGQDPEHGESVGHLWCIDPTKRGDVSPQLAVKVGDRRTPIPHRRLQAVDPTRGEVAIDNPNSAVVWHYHQVDWNGNGEVEFEEEMHRSCGTVAIKDDLLFIADFSGLFHCLDAKTGKPYWTYDLLAAAWGSPLIVNGHVYIGDEDGDVSVFELSREAHEPVAEINMGNSVYSTPIVANGVLYISNRTHLFAIVPEKE